MKYFTDEPNRCQRCESANWIIGRLTAECAKCHDILPLDHTSTTEPTIWHGTGSQAAQASGKHFTLHNEVL